MKNGSRIAGSLNELSVKCRSFLVVLKNQNWLFEPAPNETRRSVSRYRPCCLGAEMRIATCGKWVLSWVLPWPHPP